MTFFGQENDTANSNAKIGVLLVNLGSPDRPIYTDLRRYLSEFLMDPRVIELPTLFRTILVKGIIANFRSRKSATSYQNVWTNEGAPLLINSLNLGQKVADSLGNRFEVEVGMRYGKPSIQSKLQALHLKGVRRIVVIPLYPQYSGSTNGSTFDAIGKALLKQRWIPHLHFVSDYYQRTTYIQAIGDSIKGHWSKHGRNQKLLMSFHGVPKKFSLRGDPYEAQCRVTAQRIANYLELEPEDWQLVFQSRLGAEEWLQPYCDQTLSTLPTQGVKSVDIICPGFSVDCLETLEEIDDENKAIFKSAGGQSYSYIPCLNDSDGHAELMVEIVKDCY